MDKKAQKVAQDIGKALRAYKPYLFAIDEATEKLGNGVISLELRVFRGFVTDVILYETKRIVFKRSIDTTEK